MNVLLLYGLNSLLSSLIVDELHKIIRAICLHTAATFVSKALPSKQLLALHGVGDHNNTTDHNYGKGVIRPDQFVL